MTVSFEFIENSYQLEYKDQISLEICHKRDHSLNFKLIYTSLYKVDKMTKLKQSFLLGSDFQEKVEDAYFWGAELIHAIRDHSLSQIARIEISEEITYMQGKLFSPFVTELWSKYC